LSGSVTPDGRLSPRTSVPVGLVPAEAVNATHTEVTAALAVVDEAALQVGHCYRGSLYASRPDCMLALGSGLVPQMEQDRLMALMLQAEEDVRRVALIVVLLFSFVCFSSGCFFSPACVYVPTDPTSQRLCP
jgi:hypothetical protein